VVIAHADVPVIGPYMSALIDRIHYHDTVVTRASPLVTIK
jgi:hypothetical protein